MERALCAYTPERIEEYILSGEKNGLEEHGFPRLAANIGILMSFGKRSELRSKFLRMMDICTLQIPAKKAANDFSVREICSCLKAIREAALFEDKLVDTWCERMRGFDPQTRI